MAKPLTAANSRPPENTLAEQLGQLNEELQAIGDILDDIRTELAWGLQNGRIVISLAELHQLEQPADATVDDDLLQLTVRLHTRLATFRADITEAIERESHSEATPTETTSPTADDKHEPAEQAPSPDASQFLRGTVVHFTLDGFPYVGRFVRIEPSTGRAELRINPDGRRVTVDVSLLSLVDEDEHSPGPQKCDAPPLLLLFNVGDAVEFQESGRDLFGEIVEIDDARNEAVVMLIPSEEELTVCQDDLTKVLPDDLAYEQDWDGEEPLMDPDEALPAATSYTEPSPSLPPKATPSASREVAPSPLTDVSQMLERLSRGEVPVEDLRPEFERFVAGRESFITSLVDGFDIADLRVLARSCGYESNGKRRGVVATHIYEALLRRFACGQYISRSEHGSMLELLVSNTIDRLTPERLANHARVCRSQPNDSVSVIVPAPTLF